MSKDQGAGSTRGDEGAGWAVLFDMDGLLVDSEPVWTVAEHEIAGRLGGVFTHEAKAAMIGQRLETAIPLLLSSLGTPAAAAADPGQVAGELLARMAQLLGTAPPLMPGAAELLQALASAGVPTALVSSSYRLLVDAVLAGLWDGGTSHRFEVTVAGDEVGQGKPDPEPYLLAAQRLGLRPQQCVVLEDSTAGVQSGVAARCPVVFVPSVPAAGQAMAGRAGVEVVDSLAGVTVGALAGLADAPVGR